MKLLKISNITKTIDDKNILSNISLSFKEKGLVFIVGKSGAGKSTLLNIIGQLDSNYKGEVYLSGALCEKSDNGMCDTRRKNIGFVFQDFNLLGDLTVDENIAVAMELSDSSHREIPDYYSEFDIKECKDKQCKYMSGGERQRTALVRAICKESRIILADEPTGNLDQNNSKIVFEALKNISDKRLVIVVTHDLEAANNYGDRIITLSDGKLISDEVVTDNKKSEFETVNSIVEKNVSDADIKGKEEGAEAAKVSINSKNNLKQISKKHLKNNRRRNFMIVVMCVVLMLFCVATISLVNAMKAVNVSINAVFENDRLQIYNLNEDTNSLYIIPEDFIGEISAYNCNEIVEYHRLALGTYKAKDYISINYKVYSSGDFFKQRFGYYGIDMPDNENGIIVNNVFAEKVFGTQDCIGKTVDIYAYADICVTCRVTAVSEIIEDERPSVYISDSILKVLNERTVETKDLATYSASHMNYSFLTINKTDNEEKIIYGNIPQNDNEALINAGGINSIISVLELPYSPVSVKDVLNGEVSDEIINSILNSVIPVEANGGEEPFANLKIVGIAENEEENLGFLVSEATYLSLKNIKPNIVEIYLKDLEENKKQIEDIVEKYKYTIGDLGSIKATVVVSKMTVPTVIMAVLSVVAFIIVFMFIRFTTKLHIMNQINEIGILKALGANNRQIGSLYISENIYLFSISMIITVIFTIILQVLKSFGYLTIDGIEIYDINVIYLLGILVIGVITVCLATLFEVKKISKLNLVELLRKNN